MYSARLEIYLFENVLTLLIASCCVGCSHCSNCTGWFTRRKPRVHYYKSRSTLLTQMNLVEYIKWQTWYKWVTENGGIGFPAPWRPRPIWCSVLQPIGQEGSETDGNGANRAGRCWVRLSNYTELPSFDFIRNMHCNVDNVDKIVNTCNYKL
jgi:hypothetical protein